jgi:hypothetical protein
MITLANEQPKFESFGIASSSMLVELSISCWTARKKDKKVSMEVDASKNTKVKAGNYNKNLLAGSPALEAVVKYAANVRLWNNLNTLPWSDSGLRIVTAEHLYGKYKSQLDEHKRNFDKLVENFVQQYPTLIAAAAFQLGDLFDRDEYPSQEAVAKKFGFTYALSPVPTAGDFRIDINEQAKAELVTQYEQHFQGRVDNAMREIWDRLHTCLLHMSERLTDTDEGGRKVFHSTLLSNADELLVLLKNLNVAKDPALEDARASLEAAIHGTDMDDLKDSDYIRQGVKEKVDAILGKFDW